MPDFEKKHYICDWRLVHILMVFRRSKDANNL